MQYYLQLAQQHQQALQGTNIAAPSGVTMSNTNTLNASALQNTIQLSTGQLAPITTINANGTQQNILVTNTGQQISSVGGVVNNLGKDRITFFFNLIFQSNVFLILQSYVLRIGGGLQATTTHQTQAPIQLLQQIVTPNGEIQHMPVSSVLKFSNCLLITKI